jgi:2-C-methyl-D-erythritol 4-phosphate cytidylyltransferase
MPKQYQPLAGSPMVLHTLRALSQLNEVHTLSVVVHPTDDRMAGLLSSDTELCHVRVWPVGGSTRAQSVCAGLQALISSGAGGDDWVLVHDAARCLIEPEAVRRLMVACHNDPVGGLLALPLPDTLKQADAGHRIETTLRRDDKWLAQTPQMFRLQALSQALANAGSAVTDEASAMELQGLKPLLVPGSALNFKVTYPDDLRLAAMVLAARQGDSI